MRKKLWKSGVSVLLAATLCLGTAMPSFASTSDSSEDTTVSGEITQDDTQQSTDTGEDSADEEVVVTAEDKPYLALGEDLSSDQKKKVLSLLGVDEDKLDDYSVEYITNDQEHDYLDSYISKDKIGTKSLSSVVVIAGEKGKGVNVTTKNINYCTTGMYENAMTTAGIEDADVIVAAPFEISGTAALIGVIKAYTAMTGEKVNEENVDAALNEMVVTGAIENSKDGSDTTAQQVEGMVAALKEKVASGDLSTTQIGDAIDSAAKEFNVSLSEDEKAQLQSVLEKISSLDLNVNSLKNQAQGIYDKLSNMGINVDTSEIAAKAEGFFTKLINWIKSLFS